MARHGPDKQLETITINKEVYFNEHQALVGYSWKVQQIGGVGGGSEVEN